jgi:hypothetical protein
MSSSDPLIQLDSHLASGRQAWLFGAGISIGANIPLMVALTKRVSDIVAGKPAESLINAAKADLPVTAHIEHILSQLGDYAAIAERSQQDVKIGKSKFTLADLKSSHDAIVSAIGETIRWGYKMGAAGASDEIGTSEKPLVNVTDHRDFMRALLGRSRAGIAERRQPIKFFTTNYDTLLEDSLALEAHTFWDGFSGGAVAFRSFRYGDVEPSDAVRAHVIKLHGSIDWHLCDDGKIWRVRDKDLYPSKSGRVLIYPQSTKYLATQRDPFAAQFDLLRRNLSQKSENVLAICGYSFGDEHINQEIELAMKDPDNKTTIIAFSGAMVETLVKWRGSKWGKRIFVVTPLGLYVGSEGPYYERKSLPWLDWWTFSGVTKILNKGAEACVL